MKRLQIKSYKTVLVLAVLITGVCIYFCIPHFIEKEKIDELVVRMQDYLS